MKKKYVFFMLVIILTLSLSACSKNKKIDETFDKIAEKIELQKKTRLSWTAKK